MKYGQVYLYVYIIFTCQQLNYQTHVTCKSIQAHINQDLSHTVYNSVKSNN